MCNEGIKITIEEWAGDNSINLSDEQIEELVYAIDVAYDMSLPCGYGVGQVETKERSEISYLKSQIDLLQRFIADKGYCITLFDNRIERLIVHKCGELSYTSYETFR
jgi:hypothetical protein